jgi:superfamily II DNA/RNA helicase
MDVFDVRDRLIEDYKQFTSSFVEPRDVRIDEHVSRLSALGYQWPAPYLSLNPNFASGGPVDDLIRDGLLHPDNDPVFRIKRGKEDPGAQSLRLHQHQVDAIDAARRGASYVLTTGTGSGKSLSYIVPIVDRVLRAKANGTYRPGVKAIIVYPMNALANSQLHELEKFLCWGLQDNKPAVSFSRYTGQEGQEDRRRILADPPDILLTNYVMLELVLTRRRERERLVRAARGLWFLVLDELHTYRGRQGADVAFLVRRTRDACDAASLQCIGTSATMTTEGSAAEQRAEVAEVASRLFGTAVEPSNVIGESLRRATVRHGGGSSAAHEVLTECTRRWASNQPPEDDFATFRTDPLAFWVEGAFGIEDDNVSGRLVRRRLQQTVPGAAGDLAELIGLPDEVCQGAIQAVLQAGARIKDPETDRPLFAFRVHQFLSKGDNVYVTIEPAASRHITSRYQAVAPASTDAERKILVPLAFCRECGQEYLIVRRSVTGFEAGNDSDVGDGDAGYLYISDDQPWPEDYDAVLREARLPYSWTTIADDGATIVAPGKEKYLPEVVQVDPSGAEVARGRGLPAAWVSTPFRFCLRCQVSYERQRGKDFAQLAKLSVEGRSSALSVVGASVVRTLRAAQGLQRQAQKVLAFVDNRQDASLQAGHFNDFVQVVQLRGALYRAVAAESDGLTHERVAQRVTEALSLELSQFARRPEVRFGKEEIWRALREVVNYRLYLDLERGWRVTMPNLEQTGLLRIGYRYLDEVAADRQIWNGSHHILQDDAPEHRHEIAATLLDELRRNLAIDVRCLTEDGFDEIRRLSLQHLAEPWKLGDRERATVAGIAFPKPSSKGRPRSYLHLSGRGAFGKYLVRQYRCRVDEAQEIIRDLLEVLAEAGLVIQVVPPDEHDLIGGYRLKSDALVWLAGEGKVGAEDRVRKVLSGEAGARVNEFFRDLYRDTSQLLAGLQAKEHTAQVEPKQRQEREQEFRDGDLPLLFCSPTMELGVDINALNAVALRNVPPTPANYVQRAGRAGRSGQPALVVTYCSTGNAHDQYYFRRPWLMVGGAVQPPRLDLANEDLVRSHLQAIWLAETGEELPSSLVDLMETGGEQPTLKLKAKIESALRSTDACLRAVARADAALAGDIGGELSQAPWWRPNWVTNTIDNAYTQFENALERWRTLYRAARKEYEVQGKRAVDTNVSARARDEAKRRADDARIQLNLLANENSDEPQTDFYTYRYLASEGFLPGYSFPRLPLAAYVPGLHGGQRQGDYIHRPRFIGISEFGPGALIYHEGARYMVRGVQLQQAATPGQDGVLTTASRRCVACGHLHEDRVGVDLCDNCHEPLGGSDTNLLRLYTVRTQRRERISSDEEERRRSGFQIETSYRFHHHGSRPGRLTADVTSSAGMPLATLVYGDAATVRRANLGLTRRKDEKIRGFWLDTTSGEWLSEKKAADMASDTMTSDEEDVGAADGVKLKQRVIPYVEDRRNVLVLRLVEKVSVETALSLLYALERGIEATFQLEDSELTGELLPDPEGRGRMLFIESAEGGAGVLRRLVEEENALQRAADKALEIAHFDPETGEETEQTVEGDGDRCVQGCYDCLLSYSNQPHHKQIDRHLVVDFLLDLASAAAERHQTAAAPPAAATLQGPAGEFAAWLAEAAYRAPDDTGVRIAGTVPDLVYREARAAIFVDLPGQPYGDGRDVDAEESLYDAGWTPIRVKAGEWQSAVEQYPSVFGQHQQGGSV